MNLLSEIVDTLGIQFKDISDILNISPKTVNDWVKCRRNIPKQRLSELSNVFKIDFSKNSLNEEDKLNLFIGYVSYKLNREVLITYK